MAREDVSDKTEPATPRRRQESREQGQVAKSADLTAAVALLGAMLILNFAGPSVLRDLVGLMRSLLEYHGPDAVLPESMIYFAMFAGTVLVRTAVPLCVALMLIAVFVSVAQVGLMFTFEPLQPKLSRIDPIAGMGKIFSLQSVVKLLISIFKIGLIGAVAFLTIRSRMEQIIGITGLYYWKILGVACELIFILGIRMGLVLLILAIIDYIYQRYRHEQTLKMTKQEVKEEMRRMEGDPLIRERRKRVARQLAMQRMQYAVPNADVIVTNPTELAVAIRYEPQSMSAPRVVAKGAGLLAERIRQIAIDNGIPIVQRRPLAQTLYKTVEVGDQIPPAFYKAIAEILAYVYELTGRSSVATAGGG